MSRDDPYQRCTRFTAFDGRCECPECRKMDARDNRREDEWREVRDRQQDDQSVS